MGRQRKSQEVVGEFYRPIDPDVREQQMIGLAVDLAEQRLRDGSASSQIIEHFLKLGSSRAKLEMELMAEDLALKGAKRDSIRAERTDAEKYQQAIDAMRIYTGNGDPDDYHG